MLERPVLSANFAHPFQRVEYPALIAVGVGTLFGELTVKFAAVEITAVEFLVDIRVICIVVQLTDFIAAVDDGDAAEGKHERVEHYICFYGDIQRLVVLIPQSRLNTAKAGGRTA